jgi:hypothetical protein
MGTCHTHKTKSNARVKQSGDAVRMIVGAVTRKEHGQGYLGCLCIADWPASAVRKEDPRAILLVLP